MRSPRLLNVSVRLRELVIRTRELVQLKPGDLRRQPTDAGHQFAAGSSAGRRSDRVRAVILALALGLGLLGSPRSASAQTPTKVPRLGILTPGGCPDEARGTGLPANLLLADLKARGYVPGQNIFLECRFSDKGDADQFRGLADELVRLNVDVIFTVSSSATRAVRLATSTIPVVALDLETDPVASGLAASLARPGGNVTGIFLDAPELNGKWFDLLKSVVPRLRQVAALWDATVDPAPLSATEAAARSLGIRLHVLAIRSPDELETAFRAAKRERVEAVLVMQSPLTDVHGKKIATLSLQNNLPTIAMFPTFPQQGGLMSYGPDVGQLFAHAASFIDRILRGARPGAVPIERPIRFPFVVNGKTAKALGLTIPSSLWMRADQVIE